MVFFSQTLPKYYKQKNTHTKKKENPHSIVIIIEFLSIFFVAFCNFLNFNSLLLFGPTRFIFTAQEGEEENNLITKVSLSLVFFSISMLISIWQIWRKYTKDVMFEYHIWQPSDRTYMYVILTLTQNAAGFAGPGGVGDGETPDSIRALRLHHHGGGPTTVCPLLEVATEWALSYGVCAVWIVTKDPGDLRLIAYLSKKITRGALV